MPEKLRVGAIACMDEDLDYGPGVVVFGIAGSAVTKIGGGKQDLFPDSQRKMVKRVRKAVFGGLKKVAKEIKVPLVSCSHAGCGAAGAQGIPVESVSSETKKIFGHTGIPYVGHVPHASGPVQMGRSKLSAFIGRHEEEHHHGARRIIITVGGGITESEIQAFESDGYGDGFVVSADWIAPALASGSIEAADAISWLMLHVDIADGIADGVVHAQSVRIHNAGRLLEHEIAENTRVARDMLAQCGIA